MRSSSVFGFATTSSASTRADRLRVQHRPAADLEGAQVAVDRGAVQPDRLPDRIARQRHQPRLPCRAQQHHVGIDRIPQHPPRQIGGVEHRQPLLQPRLQRQSQPFDRQLELAVAGEVAGDDLVAVHHRAGAAAAGQPQRLGPGRDHQIAADQRIGLASGDPDRGDVLGGFASRQCRCTAPPFCASPAISISPAPLPSRCAAIASTAPIVTTPVPPTPVITTLKVP